MSVDRYKCSTGCGARRSSWLAIRTHEMTCIGKPPVARQPPKSGKPR